MPPIRVDRRLRCALLATLFSFPPVLAQSTQGWVGGRVYDEKTGAGIEGAQIACQLADSDLPRNTISAGDGKYYIPLLSPGVYTVRVTTPAYQARTGFEVVVFVGGTTNLDLPLRQADDVYSQQLYTQGFASGTDAIVHVYAADLTATQSQPLGALRSKSSSAEASQSYIMTARDIDSLPLAGRDVFTAVALQPGLTSETAIARGLGVSASGQRPSSSNYVLDGLEINDPVVTGPMALAPPEAVLEYRVSAGNFSAEFGRTAGFVANAITRSGTDSLHGLAYVYGETDALNANGWEQNSSGFARPPLGQIQPGIRVTGPLKPGSLFGSLAFEAYRFRTDHDPEKYLLPTPAFIATVDPSTAPGRWLREFAPAVPNAAPGANVAKALIRPPSEIDRYFAVPRVDAISRGGLQRFFIRGAMSRINQPGLLFTPYQYFSAPYNQRLLSVAAGLVSVFSPRLTNEARVGTVRTRVTLDRPDGSVPSMASSDGTVLPGSPAFYAYRNRSAAWEFTDNLVVVTGPHLLRVGAGILERRLWNTLTAGRDGRYFFDSLAAFASSSPSVLLASYSATAPEFTPARFDRTYRYAQTYAFAQDSYRATQRLNFSLGFRYERFGTPRSEDDAPDIFVQFGPGPDFPARIATARPIQLSGPHDMFNGRPNNWAGRFGFTYGFGRNSTTVLRGGYGLFYDRLFDNFWQTASVNAIGFGIWNF